MELFRNIATNILLLFGLIFILSLSNKSLDQKSKMGKIFIGVIIGSITIFIMMNAWTFNDGIFYDTRTVMISTTAMFFSYTSSIIAAIIALVYRIIIGGPGVYVGCLTIIFSLLVGILWKKYILSKFKINKLISYYLMGIVVHILMLLSQLALPSPQNFEVLADIWLFVIILFPLSVALLSKAVSNYSEKLTLEDKNRKNDRKYRTLIDNTTLGIIHFNTEGIILLSNKAFAEILGTTQEELKNLSMFKLPNKKLVQALKDSLTGKISIFEDYYISYLSNKKIPVRVQFSPIYDKGLIIGGIGTIEDQTDMKRFETKISELSTNDMLTQLLNRTAFDLELISFVERKDDPLSISTCDINTFHVINTTFGYEKGNEVLVELSNSIKVITQSYSGVKAYRVGGDEFSLIMYGYSNNEAKNIMNEIKTHFQNNSSFDFDLSISCGISSLSNDLPTLTHVFNDAIAKMHTNKVYDGSSISIKTVDLIMQTLFEKSERERMHSERVSQLSKLIAQEISDDQSFINRTELAGKMHDIGKITVLEEILEKQGKLTSEEYAKIKKHSETGYGFLSSVPEYREIANIVLYHHEKYDGTGYPKGLKHSDTPLESRIICVADAYDAMVNTRPYRKGLSKDEAIKELKDYSGTQFDPMIVETIIKLNTENQI